MTPSSPAQQDIEQYRPGFEAWARKEGHDTLRDEDGYYWIVENTLWTAWIAAKRDTSTSQGAAPGDALDAARYRYPTAHEIQADVAMESTAVAAAISALSDTMDECPLTDSLKIYAAIELAFKYCEPKHVEEVFAEIVLVRGM